MDDFWPLGISSHGKEEIWFVEVSANGHSILEQLGHKPRTSYMRRRKNEFVFQKLTSSPSCLLCTAAS